MAAAKLQVCRPIDGSPDIDTVTCAASADRRGFGKEVGFPDAHRTVAEVDPASDSLISEILAFGPTVNATLQRIVAIEPTFLGQFASLLGLEGDGAVFARIILMDE